MRPGVFEVRASARWPVSALTRLDLPTLERPAKASSGRVGAGRPSGPATPATKRQAARTAGGRLLAPPRALPRSLAPGPRLVLARPFAVVGGRVRG